MDAEDVTNTLETGECLLVAQEVKGKSMCGTNLTSCGKYWRSRKT
jgi:hypothetical protein